MNTNGVHLSTEVDIAEVIDIFNQGSLYPAKIDAKTKVV